MTEIELCQKVVDHYSDYEVYKEVNLHGRCDIVVNKGGLIVAIEAKLQFSTTLIYQAIRHFPYSHYTYVAVPKQKNDSTAHYSGRIISEKLGIGVLRVSENGTIGSPIEKLLPAQYRRNIHRIDLPEKQKYAIAGAQNNNMSEFKCTMREIERFLKEKGGIASTKELFQDKFHWSSPQSAKAMFFKLFKKGNSGTIQMV